MVGNLVDNACKWARRRASVWANDDGHRGIVIVVEDDGDGLPETKWTEVLGRGVRADESTSGSGLGLAIVRDLADLYGGTLTLGRAELGGLRAELRLPGA
jgi:signal transduction histidine kinase